MNKFLLAVIILFLSISLHDFKSYGTEPDPEDKDLETFDVYDTKQFMTGDWGGLRPRLNELGITPYARYYFSILGNPVGGERKGVQYAGLFNVHLDLDLDRLLKIPRTEFIFRAPGLRVGV